jgi:hypothetical protein
VASAVPFGPFPVVLGGAGVAAFSHGLPSLVAPMLPAVAFLPFRAPRLFSRMWLAVPDSPLTRRRLIYGASVDWADAR